MSQNIPLIATNNCMFGTPDMYEAHDALICIAEGKVVVDDNRKKLNPEFHFKSSRKMVELFADIPEAVTNTVEFAKRCSVAASSRKPMLPKFPTSRTDDEELRHQALEGLKERLADVKCPHPNPLPQAVEGTYAETPLLLAGGVGEGDGCIAAGRA